MFTRFVSLSVWVSSLYLGGRGERFTCVVSHYLHIIVAEIPPSLGSWDSAAMSHSLIHTRTSWEFPSVRPFTETESKVVSVRLYI